MENFALIAVAESLRPAMGEIIIRRVVQHQPNGFILQTRSLKLPALKILMNAQTPAFYASDAKPPMESPNTDFLMVLRKHFTSAELVDFRKPLSERALELVFKTAVPSKELETMSLVLELIPNAPNVILLDGERRVLSSFSAITPQHGIGEFDPYVLPLVRNKIDLERLLQEDIPELIEVPRPQNDREWLMTRVAGIGPIFADEILFRCRQKSRSVTAEIRDILQQVHSPQGGWIYTEKPLGHILEQNDLRSLGKAILSPVELLSLERSHSSRIFGKIGEAARFYFDELESRILLDSAKLPLMRDLRTASKRLTDREKRLNREQRKYEDAERNQQKAQLLASSGMKLDQRYDRITVTDYFREKPEEVQIDVDPALTLRENIDKMFKLHQKAGRGRQMVATQLNRVRSRVAAIDEQVRRLQAIKDWDTWLAISDRIEKEQRGPASDPARPEALGRRFRTFLVEDREILIGRSGKENDELTFRIASSDDFWFHVADYSGSHVVVRNPGRERELPEAVLTKAAQLAAYFSQARNSTKVEVHYTRRKHVIKPRRAKPGLVRLLEFKSITVEPKNWLEETT